MATSFPRSNIEQFDPERETFHVFAIRLSQFLTLNRLKLPPAQAAIEVSEPASAEQQQAEAEKDEQRRAILLGALQREQLTRLVELCSDGDPNNHSYSDLLTLLRTHYSPQPLQIEARFTFAHRNQLPGESIDEYSAALNGLSNKCGFAADVVDPRAARLRDQFIVGLRDASIQTRLLAEKDDCTYGDVLKLAKVYEQADATAKRLQGLSTSTAAHYVRYPPSRKPEARKSHGEMCTFCGKSGHTVERCWKRQGQQQGRQRNDSRSRPPVVAADETPRTAGDRGRRQRSSSRSRVHRVELRPIDWVRAVSAHDGRNDALMTSVRLDGVELLFELDSGAAESIMSEDDRRRLLPRSKIRQGDIRLAGYGGRKLPVLGEILVDVELAGQHRKQLPLVIVQSNGPPLFGRPWLRAFGLTSRKMLDLLLGAIRFAPPPKSVTFSGVDQVQQLPPPANPKRASPSSLRSTTSPRPASEPPALRALLAEFADLFDGKLGALTGPPAKVHLKCDATPRFFRARPIPFALRPKVEAVLDRWEAEGVVEKVEHSDWAAPIVPIQKTTGDIRICADYKVGVNQEAICESYPLPKNDAVFAGLHCPAPSPRVSSQRQKFSKVDLADAFNQIRLDEHASKILTINTHKGLYRMLRLPFGFHSSPAIFQRRIDTLFGRLSGVVAFVDDLCVTGADDAEHLANLRRLFERFRDCGAKVKLAKCDFFADSVEYLGHMVDADGVHPQSVKLDAIQRAPRPTDVSQLRAFIGLVTYYGDYVRNLSMLAHPLYALLKADARFVWSDACQRAFDALKAALCSDKVLCHYDPTLPLLLACDASSYGIGAVLSHVFPDGSQRPIACASRTLTDSERNYSQLEKEALAIIFAVKKFERYLLGREQPFSIVSDHNPLVALFGEKRSLPMTASGRILRWAAYLSGFNYTFKYVAGKKLGNADGLSRLPLPRRIQRIHNVESARSTPADFPIRSSEIAAATQKDKVMSKVLRFVRDGWPSSFDDALKPFARCRDELSIDGGCILRGTRVVPPDQFRRTILRELHDGHPGIVRMKALARSYVWWPGIDADIESTIRSCTPCHESRSSPPEAPLHLWSLPSKPWQRLHVDYAGPLHGRMWILIVDARTKWPVVWQTPSASAKNTIEILRRVFTDYGDPEQIVSDNATCFTSAEFAEFCRSRGIRHTFSPPYSPKSNGEAERFVRTFKAVMTSSAVKQSNAEEQLSRFIRAYRVTPHATTGRSPAEMLGRSIRIPLDLLKPNVDRDVAASQDRQRMHVPTTQLRTFSTGQQVWARDHRRNAPFKWQKATIVSPRGSHSYDVLAADGSNRSLRVHVDQLFDRTVSPDIPRESSRSADVEQSLEPAVSADVPVDTAADAAQPAAGTDDSSSSHGFEGSDLVPHLSVAAPMTSTPLPTTVRHRVKGLLPTRQSTRLRELAEKKKSE